MTEPQNLFLGTHQWDTQTQEKQSRCSILNTVTNNLGTGKTHLLNTKMSVLKGLPLFRLQQKPLGINTISVYVRMGH
jgi:hypothetical protein